MKLNIGYFADGPWSHLAFEKIIRDPNIYISFICARYDTDDTVLQGYCSKYEISYLKTKDINSKKFISKISKFNCNLFVSMSFNQIFKHDILSLPLLKTINCHAGKLPFYRGRNILNWALINDEKDFGITVHFVNEGIDTGDILLQKIFPITDEDNYATLLNLAYIECANILYSAIKLIEDNKIVTLKQSEIDKNGSYFRKRLAGDEIINWNQTSRQVFNFVRAICRPGPMAISYINSNLIKINKVEECKDFSFKPLKVGDIFKIDSNSFYVKTKDRAVKVTEFEYDFKLSIGDRLEEK